MDILPVMFCWQWKPAEMPVLRSWLIETVLTGNETSEFPQHHILFLTELPLSCPKQTVAPNRQLTWWNIDRDGCVFPHLIRLWLLNVFVWNLSLDGFISERLSYVVAKCHISTSLTEKTVVRQGFTVKCDKYIYIRTVQMIHWWL